MTSLPDHDEVLSIAIDSFLPAPPHVVFEALVDPVLFAQWMGPEGSETVVDSMDATPGGSFTIRVQLPGGGPEISISGAYVEVDPPSRLVHTWLVAGDQVATDVTFQLHAHDGGTRLVLTHSGFTDHHDLAANDGGWRHQIGRLERVVARRRRD